MMTTKWNANLYDDKHQFVSKYGEGLISFLQPKNGEHILDVGCGTGDLANQIDTYGATVIGVDATATMIEQAQQKYTHIQFDVRDVKNLGFDNQFDAIFSNATLHWVKEPDKALASMFKTLKKGGRLVAEMGGSGNIQSIAQATEQTMNALNFDYQAEKFPWYFPTVAEYTKLLDEQGFTVQYIELYERPTELAGEDGVQNWLKMFSNSLFEHLSDEQKQQVYEEAEKRLRGQIYHDGKWIADYCRLRFIAYKK